MFRSIDCKWRIEPHFPPIGDAVGQFWGSVERVIWDDAAREVGLLEAVDRVVEVLLQRPLADFGDLCVVDLDLVGDRMCRDWNLVVGRSRCTRRSTEKDQREREGSSAWGRHSSNLEPVSDNIRCLRRLWLRRWHMDQYWS